MFEKLIPEKGGDGTRSEGLLRVVADVLEPTGASSWFDFEWAVAGWPLPAGRLSLSPGSGNLAICLSPPLLLSAYKFPSSL